MLLALAVIGAFWQEKTVLPTVEGEKALASWRKVAPHLKDFVRYELLIKGKPTRLFSDINSSSDWVVATVNKTPRGVIYGAVDQTASGAITTSWDTAFAVYRGKCKLFPDRAVLSRVGEYILLLRPFDPLFESSGDATLYCLGRWAKVGLVRRAVLNRDGTVIGWYPIVDGKPYSGPMNSDTSPADTVVGGFVTFKKRYFVYKSRKRREAWSLKELGVPNEPIWKQE